ncbi:3-oxoacyl-[acyl-carrier-protein] synthase-3 [Desulfuromusa kysingii]|uniref:3-oxoacyl-[acyl-carrier-protein] synthase-3 n=1 Tax=Desulfuromusa kysingii TaxID=37625 RepID=A0A1H3VQ69_9BACT|nr:beta-ketoacyl-ACP synthase III [Desulfuromusa kysingii]SDZ76910.1 3-oxoacyl-[acyl-carrier-protein] synthase-3 [Desulfuromusa kysingii]
MSVYITDLASFLPNNPVSNEQMEGILGLVNQLPSRTRRIILRNNKIKTRYYAIDPESGQSTHSNAQLSAEAVKNLHPYEHFKLEDIECLCCGTSTPDQILPGHAPMVHGELGGSHCEVLSAAGVCTAGMSALKYAWMNVALGLSKNAVATGSELVSTFMHARLCGEVDADKAAQLESQPGLSFEADFLRWMLSDGAGAAFLSSDPSPQGISLRIDWIDLISYANEMETCMYAGADKLEDGTIRGWRENANLADAIANHTFMIKQDVKLLNKEIITFAVERALAELVVKHKLNADEIDWFIPHYSSAYFRDDLRGRMEKIGLPIPTERWFTNLATKGNTGSASIYIMLEELFHSGQLKKGEKLLCFIPESGRFSMCYMLLTVC